MVDKTLESCNPFTYLLTFADQTGDAAKKLGDASYDFAKEVDWNNGIFFQAPGKFQPLQDLKAIDKMIVRARAACAWEIAAIRAAGTIATKVG